jgi:hypothetical protein
LATRAIARQQQIHDLTENTMSGLRDAVDDAYRRAELSCDPADWALFHSLNATLQAERTKRHEPGDTTGILDPPVSEIRIERPEVPGDSS